MLPRRCFTRPGTGGTYAAEYCYSVWLRHLVHLHQNGLIAGASALEQVAEIGPGDSLGTGMAALYSGTRQYTALDVIRHADVTVNRKVNDKLLQLFLQHRDIPCTDYPDLYPALTDYRFPVPLVSRDDQHFKETHQLLSQSLHPEITDGPLRYIVPWMDTEQLPRNELDLIFSQAAMEHVEDIGSAYMLMYRMLKKGGVISHQIDFRAHEMTNEWDGHFYIRKNTWSILSHGRKYPMNRLPLSAHLKAATAAGFRIATVVSQTGAASQHAARPAVPAVDFNQDDFVTMGALLQAIK